MGQEDPLEEGRASHSSISAWRIPWTKEPGRLQPIASQRVRNDWSNLAQTHPDCLLLFTLSKYLPSHWVLESYLFVNWFFFCLFPTCLSDSQSFPGDSVVKNLPAMQETQIWSLGVERRKWRRKWQPTPVFLPGKFHGQESLVGYHP